MVDSARKPIPLGSQPSPVCTMQAARTKSSRRAQKLRLEWSATQSPSRAQSNRVTNTVYRNNYRRNLHRGSRSGFAHLLSSYCPSGPSESTVPVKMLG
jgi:hypothetical protein